jgi:hypothetical protein
MTESATRQRLVIYTVLTGSKEPLGDPLAQLPPGSASDLELSFVCFTDNRKLSSPVWQMRYIDQLPLPAEKLSRRPKALPHEYLQDWEYSLYIDNITQFKRLPQAADLAHEGAYLFKAFKHATRENPLQEAEAIVQLGYESAENICRQLDFYARQFPLESIAPLSTCTVLLRQHGHPAIRQFGLTWWEQILNYGKRDQMSFDFALKWNRTRLQHLPGLKHDNELIHNTANIQPNRVHANFDPVRYAWAHRDDPAAQRDPRQHYLDHGRLEGRNYVMRGELLEFFSYRYRSSLGSRVAPRRGIAMALQELLLLRRAHQSGGLLLIRIKDEGPLAYSAEEMAAAEAALSAFLPGYQGARLELSSAQLAEGRLGFRAGESSFDLVVMMGVPGALLRQAHTLVQGALNAAGGQLCVLASGACLLADVAAVEAALPQGRASVQASRHDELDLPLPNSLLSFSWGPQNSA